MGGRVAIAVMVVAVVGCGRLGFDQSTATSDGGPDSDGPTADAEPGAKLGEFCDESLPSQCQSDLACVLSTCSCLAQVKSDEFQTCSLSPGGFVRCSGDNGNGEIGNGTVGGFESSPIKVEGVPPLVELDLGAFHACGATKSGELWCWGQIDLEAATGTPYSVTLSSAVTTVASGGFHACVLTADETVSCLGRNSDGQIGVGMAGATEPAPRIVSGLTNVVALASGGFHSCAIVRGGAVSCWGRNADGQVGDGTTGNDRPAPTPTGITNAVQISLGDFHSCARLDDGTVQCWGRNDVGQLGRGVATVNGPNPTAVVNLSTVVDLFAGDDTVCVIDGTNALRCWGNNSDGQLGFASTGVDSFETEPQTFPTLPTIDVAVGRFHTCVLQKDGAVLCSGRNSQGEFGDGSEDSATEPVGSLLSCK